jgi:hypothetical protein
VLSPSLTQHQHTTQHSAGCDGNGTGTSTATLGGSSEAGKERRGWQDAALGVDGGGRGGAGSEGFGAAPSLPAQAAFSRRAQGGAVAPSAGRPRRERAGAGAAQGRRRHQMVRMGALQLVGVGPAGSGGSWLKKEESRLG